MNDREKESDKGNNKDATEYNNKNHVEDCEDGYFFMCPHCEIGIFVLKEEVICKIFRCGIYVSNYKPIPPHAPKEECDRLKDQNLIFGCGKPFIFKGDHVERCGY